MSLSVQLLFIAYLIYKLATLIVDLNIKTSMLTHYFIQNLSNSRGRFVLFFSYVEFLPLWEVRIPNARMNISYYFHLAISVFDDDTFFVE